MPVKTRDWVMIPDLSNNHTGGNWTSFSAPNLTSADADITKYGVKIGTGYNYPLHLPNFNVSSSGHANVSGTAPTSRKAGAAFGTLTSGSTDFVGQVTGLDSNPIEIVFAAAYASAPVCVATARGTGIAGTDNVAITGKSTTSFTVTPSADPDSIDYICNGLNE